MAADKRTADEVRDYVELMMNSGILDDDNDDTALMESYQEFLLGVDSPSEVRPMKYFSVLSPDDGRVNITESDVTREDAKILSLALLHTVEDSPLSTMDDDEFYSALADKGWRDREFKAAVDDDLVYDEDYEDSVLADRRQEDIIDDRRSTARKWGLSFDPDVEYYR